MSVMIPGRSARRTFSSLILLGLKTTRTNLLNIPNAKRTNTATTAAEIMPNMPKAAPSQQLVGQLSGKHTRERAVNCQRNNPAMVQAFNNNPYSQSLQSWA